MAWWIGVGFVVMTLVSSGAVLGAMASWPFRTRASSKPKD
jgi:hypothetical protein